MLFGQFRPNYLSVKLQIYSKFYKSCKDNNSKKGDYKTCKCAMAASIACRLKIDFG